MAALSWKGGDARAALVAGTRNGVAAGAIIVQAEVKKTLSRKGTGRKYPTLRYQSSKPGHPPAVQTGHLRRSIQVDLSRLRDPNRPTAAIGTNVKYGRWLEFGTRKMPAHPFMLQTIHLSRSATLERFAAELAAAFRKIGNG